MTILVTGGAGKTAVRIAASLAAAKKPFLLASRRGPESAPKDHPAIKFDWTDESTWSRPFEKADIKAVYMVPPQVDKPWVTANKFVDVAIRNGVQRFVLCAGTTAAIGKDGMGRVWEHFINNSVEYTVLRPTWFMENLLDPGIVYTVTKLGKIFTATQDGEIPFVSADDIADVAYHALTVEKSYDRDFRVLGPEILTYDLVAETLSEVLGRKIEHVKVDEESRVEGLVQAGISDYYAKFITGIEVLASQNFEKATGDDVLKVTGHPPKSFKTFAQENKGVWSLT